jgi:hypothetical protein
MKFMLVAMSLADVALTPLPAKDNNSAKRPDAAA